ncbi:MAG TPA: DUF1800 domain-containing protein [Thermoanaerobaculia bacterium]|jgi:uncharacterized protein (DUF1800 family)|nr:DUF1800 domain-containing protein [Thermoanaerobaculia bacterium]
MKRLLALASLLLLAASPAKLTERQRAQHALNRLAFGARPGDVDRMLLLGVDAWIEQQLHPERINDAAVEARLRQYATLQYSDTEMVGEFYKPLVEMRKAKKSKEELDGDPAMRELRQKARRVSAELVSQRILRAADSERQLNEVLVDFWMNHFNVYAAKGVDRFLLTSYERDVIRPHIWGRFDDLVLATAKSPAMLFYLDNARSRDGAINENYARELMELHTLGVDGGYTQKDVTELARVLTGWSIRRPQEGDAGFVFRRFVHDRGAKEVLGQKIAAGGGMEEGERMIRFLSRQPATAHHIALELCQRLVSDDPPPALVARVAQRFLATKGDLRETVRAVITSGEFWSPAAYQTKFKSPFEYAISAVRAVGATVDNPLPLARELQKIGEPLYLAQPPTGYSDRSDAWTNSGALMARLNFAVALASNKLPGVRVENVPPLDLDLSPTTRKAIADKDPVTTAGLILGSPEFQRQ